MGDGVGKLGEVGGETSCKPSHRGLMVWLISTFCEPGFVATITRKKCEERTVESFCGCG